MSETLSHDWMSVEAAIVADYQAGRTVKEVATKHGLGYRLVAGVLKRHSVTRNKGGRPKARRKWCLYTDEEDVAIRPCETAGEAIRKYFAAFPASSRSEASVANRWRHLRGESGARRTA